MKLQVPFIQLPLAFDAGVLAAEITALGEDAWRPHPQGFAGNSMLPLVALHGDPADEGFAGQMQATPLLLRCPYLMQVMESFGVVLGRSRLMRLSGHAEVTEHIDQAYYWAERVRVHVPIVTQPSVRFDCGGASIHMAAGECWIFDTWRKHRVLNDAVESRIHLVADTVGGAGFWDLVSRGRAVDVGQSAASIDPVAVPVRPGHVPVLHYESSNIPVVMSPWEVNTHLRFLLSEAVPGQVSPQLQQVVARFSRHWHALWARFGETEAGHPQFRELLDQFVKDAHAPSQHLMLRNERPWYEVMLARVAAAAVRPADASGTRAAHATGDLG